MIYAPGPFRDWLWGLIKAEEQAGWGTASRRRVARRLEVSDRCFDDWLHRATSFDETTIDWACSRHGGVMISDIYGHPPARAKVPVGRNEVPRCSDPACTDIAGWGVQITKKDKASTVTLVEGRRFCRPHAERLVQITIELTGDSDLMAANGGAPRGQSRKRTKKEPTCCSSGCWGPREGGETFCGGDICLTTGARDGDCE